MTSAAELTLTRDEILKHAQSLPAAPQVLGGLCELLEDVNTELEQIADAIRRDPALAARVIRLANSVGYGGGGGVASIDEAVNRIGFAEIIRLVGVATVSGLVDRSLRTYGIEAERLRESLLLHAVATEAIARATGQDERSGYAAGLLRGLGMMVLDRVSRDRIDPADTFNPQRFRSYAEWEFLRFGLTSADVATMILDDWHFPSELVTAIEQHLVPGDHPLANALNLAGAVVAERGLALPGEQSAWQVSPAKLAIAGLDEDQWQAVTASALSAFERQRAALY